LLAGIRGRLTYANVMASIAVFIALGAGAYAAGLAPNSVKSKHIAPDAAKGVDIDESTLSEVPSAQDAETLDGKFSGQFQQIKAQQWTPLALNDGTLDEPGQLCVWENYGDGFNSGEYRRDQDGDVHVRGLVRASDVQSGVQCGNFLPADYRIGTLPMGSRPAAQNLFPVLSNNKLGRVDIAPNGDMVINPNFPSFPDAEAWVALDGISFACAPSGQNGCP